MVSEQRKTDLRMMVDATFEDRKDEVFGKYSIPESDEFSLTEEEQAEYVERASELVVQIMNGGGDPDDTEEALEYLLVCEEALHRRLNIQACEEAMKIPEKRERYSEFNYE